MPMTSKYLFQAFFALFLLASLAAPVLAQDASEISEIETNYDGTTYEYVKPSMENLSQLYWGLSKFDIGDNEAIDNFLMINECDLFKNYFANEFEWSGIREASRAFLTESKKSFPLRFEFMQPLFLGEYDIERERFNIANEYKINGVRRLQVISQDFNQPICNVSTTRIPGYPRGMVVELSRPLNFTYIPVPKDIANVFIKEKLDIFRSARNQNTKTLEESRDAYVVMQIKIFAYKGETRVEEGNMFAEVLAVLEGLEVYSDRHKNNLLYAKHFRKRAKKIEDPLEPVTAPPIESLTQP